METVTVSPKFQILIPKSVRAELNIKSGEKLTMIEKNGVLYVIPNKKIKESRGMISGLDTRNLRYENERFG
ncbi:MAG: AbrB family transcriptional regulator [Candidatus Diapherotrites archaeon CG08_land_8_20_14_0_20_34_12]|nr:MAG: AbrB family transcriptional regulator [Candidatus Diapherotrites archaeon CG08_land_8_20_14_0_20_34_12]